MSTIKFEATPLPTHAQANPEGPRKKRKRAPAQGAADDCFTCQNRKTRCDRRRPYCSQCLDGGQDCAGYKTQLTWGVGVASRGKLRGLSLPVAGTTQTNTISTTSSSKTKKRTASGSPKTGEIAQPTKPDVKKLSNSPPVRKTTSAFQITIPQPLPTASISHGKSREQHQVLSEAVPSHASLYGTQSNTRVASSSTFLPTLGITPVSTVFSQTTFLSPTYDKEHHIRLSPYPTPSPTVQYFQPSPIHHMPPTPITTSYHVSSNSLLYAHSPYYGTQQMPYNGQHEYVDQVAYSSHVPMTDLVSPQPLPTTAEHEIEEIERDFGNDAVYSDTISTASSSIPLDNGFMVPLSGMCGVGKTARIQYLIQYYAEVIAPVIVAFDSPSNPLRNQILGLASRSESLQHAISALSASNIRQRRESGALSTGKTPSARRSSYMHLSLMNEAWEEPQIIVSQDPRREESQHKNVAIHMLNQQLANPILRKDDSVLATLLMLCLFHICDSGIARFQTQFAGVRKLLALRGSETNGPNGDTKWMTRIFALFDSVAATVNDREGQIDGPYVEMSAQPDGEWTYETLTGIDSRLFKPMSRLGRLNILSQGKTVESNPHIVSRPLPIMSHLTSQNQGNFGTYDGNGWMRLLSDEDIFNMKTAAAGAQEQFWREWREVRQELQTWTFDTTTLDDTNSSQRYLTPEQRFDMCNISESFRYSSLLYTERLADPTMSSLDPKIQGWVQKSLYHIKQVRADVYLLWPLFITGAECGEEYERNIIRERCLDIQKDSGFMNNSSCLNLLEKVWRDSAADYNSGYPTTQQSTFRFRDVMLAEGDEGEWIVV